MKIELLKRFALLTVGLFIMSLGVALSTRANLGTSPISCVPYVLSMGLPFSIGFFTFAVHITLFLIQLLLLRRNFRPVQLLQLPAVALFSLFMDISMHLVAGVEAGNLFFQWVLLLASCLLLAFGISLEIIVDVTVLPVEGVVMSFCKVCGREFGRVKICFDMTLVLIGVVLSFYLLGGLIGIREGTVAASLSMGGLIRFFLVRVESFADLLRSRLQQDAC